MNVWHQVLQHIGTVLDKDMFDTILSNRMLSIILSNRHQCRFVDVPYVLIDDYISISWLINSSE
ncbi:hypothetical protein BLOT_000034 [Blomia tropicalis]|nr:hypothetical protein BLOT_000034 [Blomia tropicalis]